MVSERLDGSDSFLGSWMGRGRSVLDAMRSLACPVCTSIIPLCISCAARDMERARHESQDRLPLPRGAHLDSGVNSVRTLGTASCGSVNSLLSVYATLYTPEGRVNVDMLCQQDPVQVTAV